MYDSISSAVPSVLPGTTDNKRERIKVIGVKGNKRRVIGVNGKWSLLDGEDLDVVRLSDGVLCSVRGRCVRAVLTCVCCVNVC